MKTFRMPTVALFLIFFLMVNLAGCGGSTPSTPAAPVTKATLQQELTSFNSSIDGAVTDMLDMIDTLNKLSTAFAQDDGSASKSVAIGSLVDTYRAKTASFITNVEKMDQAESGIQGYTKQTGKRVELLPLIAAGLVIAGLYSFGKAMKGYSDEMSAARVERDKAASGITNNVAGADAAYTKAKKDMSTAGTAAIKELATKVTTDLILSPVNPTSVSTLIIKEVAGNVLQDGLKVVSTSEQCSSGYSTPGCTIGVSKTDKTNPAIVPSGKTTILVAGNNISRTVIKDKIFLPGKTTEVTRKEIPVTAATTEAINQNDGVVPNNPVTTTTTTSTTTTSTTTTTTAPKTLTLSSAKSSEDSTSVTYTVSALLTGVTAPTSVSMSVQNAGTGGSTKSISGNGTVSWSVTVLQQTATVTVTRLDTGEKQTLSLTGKTSTATQSYGSCTEVSGTFYKTCQNFSGAIYGDPVYGAATLNAAKSSCVSYSTGTTAQWSNSGCPTGAVLVCPVDMSGRAIDSSWQKHYYGPGYSLNPGVLEQVNGFYVLQVSKELYCQ